MQGLSRYVRSCQEIMKGSIIQHSLVMKTAEMKKGCWRGGCVNSSPKIPDKGLENTTLKELLMTKGEEKIGPWLWCRTNDTVYDALKKMGQNDIGSLVVLKPEGQHIIAGIFTERDYLRKVIVNDRSSQYTRVGEVMTDQSNLITVTSDTNILHAMQVMTENQIRHLPVVEGKIVGMISIVDIMRSIVQIQSKEVKQLNDFIKGDYY